MESQFRYLGSLVAQGLAWCKEMGYTRREVLVLLIEGDYGCLSYVKNTNTLQVLTRHYADGGDPCRLCNDCMV